MAATPDIAAAAPREVADGSRRELIATSAIATFIFFLNLWRYGFWEPDEARYAEIAREMVAGGSWLIPHLNYVVYIEKPPLLYWLTALSFHIFGINEFAARFFVAAFGVIGVATTAWFAARNFGRRHALLAGAILATTPLYAAMAQVLTTDMILAVMVTIANFAMFMHWRDGGRWCWLGYAAIALGVLTKGPVAIALPTFAMAGFIWWEWRRGEETKIRSFRLIAGGAILLAVAAPWFVAMTAKVPGFFDFYFVGEHLRRAFVSDYSHTEPFYFYVPVLVAGLLPWSLLVPIRVWCAFKPNPARRFCVMAAATTVIAFSCATAKLIPYILPALPPIAVLIADGIAGCVWPKTGPRASLPKPDSRILAESGPLLAILGMVAIGAAILAPGFRSPYPLQVRPALFACGSILIAGGAATAILFFAGRASEMVLAIVATMALTLVASSWARIEAEPLRSYASLARAIASREPDANIINYHRYVQALPFYTQKRVVLVGARTELGFGAKLSPDVHDYFFKSDEDLMRLWRSPGKHVVVLDDDDLARLKDQLGVFSLIGAEFHKRAILNSDER